MAATKAAHGGKRAGAGRKPIAFTQAQYDAARELLGRSAYPSLVADRLAAKFGFSRETCYRLMDESRGQVIDELRATGQANDPLVSIYLFLVSVIADETVQTRDRIAAASQVIKLLALDRIASKLGEQGVEEFLAGVMARKLGIVTPPAADGAAQ